MVERRKAGRRSLRRLLGPIPVSYETESAEGKGRIKRLSMRGLVLSCECPPEQGEMVCVFLEDTRGERLEICGTILSVRPVTSREGQAEHEFFVRVDADIDAYLEFYEQSLLA